MRRKLRERCGDVVPAKARILHRWNISPDGTTLLVLQADPKAT
jgi:hypothetical protein